MTESDRLIAARADDTKVLRSFLKLLGSVIALIVIGTAGYTLIEGWAILDSLYMTIITISTVGYKEVQTPSPPGQSFTIILIVFGIGIVTYSAARLGAFLIEGELRNVFENKRRRKMIANMRGHHIVCGAGRVGGEVARQLHLSGAKVVVVDQQESELLDEVKEYDLPYVLGNSTQRAVLEEANIQHAASVVTCLPSDADNVYICLIGKSIRPDLYIIARANTKDSEEMLTRAGADRVVAPYTLSADRMALLCLRPAVTCFMDAISTDFRFEEVRIPDESPLAGKELKDSGIRKSSDAIVVGILNREGKISPNPGPNSVLNGGDTLILLGSREQLGKVEDLIVKGAAS